MRARPTSHRPECNIPCSQLATLMRALNPGMWKKRKEEKEGREPPDYGARKGRGLGTHGEQSLVDLAGYHTLFYPNSCMTTPFLGKGLKENGVALLTTPLPTQFPPILPLSPGKTG